MAFPVPANSAMNNVKQALATIERRGMAISPVVSFIVVFSERTLDG
jgi:hypothetical protein